MSSTPNDLVEVGHVLDAQGVRGQLKVRPYSNDPEALLVAKEIWLIPARSTTLPKDIPIHFKVESSRFHSGNIVLQLAGVSDRDQALNLKGCVTSVSRADFPELDEDEFYWSDLIGLEVKNLQGQTLGLVEEMLDNGAQSVMAVRSDANKQQQLIPFVATAIQEVDLEARTILVDWQLDW
jgi:16S rRNA processing protein RimM